MTHVSRPGNPPPGFRRAACAAPGRLLFAALLAACAPAELSPPPAPQASFTSYQIGADTPPRPPADEYVDLFAFREPGRAARPASEPWPPGASLRGGSFNPHRRLEPRAPAPARRELGSP
ncbi:MAG: hypothetical protein MUF34_20935 [Polyangiaceae bacterium]|nr:hypothetical protein [Polyangiaceae bacterium]